MHREGKAATKSSTWKHFKEQMDPKQLHRPGAFYLRSLTQHYLLFGLLEFGKRGELRIIVN